jgi:hypothetical protein
VRRDDVLKNCAQSLPLLVALAGAAPLAEQPTPTIDPTRLTQPWLAQWIAHPEAPATGFGVLHWDLALIQALARPELATAARVMTPPENRQREIHVYTRVDTEGLVPAAVPARVHRQDPGVLAPVRSCAVQHEQRDPEGLHYERLSRQP